jgi:hypothetical protein
LIWDGGTITFLSDVAKKEVRNNIDWITHIKVGEQHLRCEYIWMRILEVNQQ